MRYGGVLTERTEVVSLVTGCYIADTVPDIDKPQYVSTNKYKAFLYEKEEEAKPDSFTVDFVLDSNTQATHILYNICYYTADGIASRSGWEVGVLVDNSYNFSFSEFSDDYEKIGFNFFFASGASTANILTLDDANITNMQAVMKYLEIPKFEIQQSYYSKNNLSLGGVVGKNIGDWINGSLVRGIVVPVDALSNLLWTLKINNSAGLYQSICLNYINDGVDYTYYNGTVWGIKQNTEVNFSFKTSQLLSKKSDITHLAISFFFSDDGSGSTAHQADTVDFDFSLQTAAVLTIDPDEDADEEAIKAYVVVKPDGTGDYTNVVDAVANEAENTPILIYPGEYIGTIQAFQKRIILIGTDRNQCIIKVQTGSYNNPPINGCCGYLENLTIYNEYVEGNTYDLTDTDIRGYAFHCESEYGVGKVLEFHHCTLKSDFSPAIGAGLRKDFHMIIDDCELINNQVSGRGVYTSSGALGALYFHDAIGALGDQYITVHNSILRSNLGNAMCPYTLKKEGNTVYCEFINNVLYDKTNGLTNNLWHRNGNAFTEGNFVIQPISSGNTNPELNSSYYTT